MPTNPVHGEYTTKSSGTNSQGNRYCCRDYGNGVKAYHYSNKDESFYYKNPDGSTYHKDKNGKATYIPPPAPSSN